MNKKIRPQHHTGLLVAFIRRNRARSNGSNARSVCTSLGQILETKDDVVTGNIVREDASAVVMKLNALLEQRIPRSDIKSVKPGAVSVMPEGLDAVLTREELLDLLAFLQAQNGEQWLQPTRRSSR